jgi:cell fate regulator YaaT (PSP1 superfamily)
MKHIAKIKFQKENMISEYDTRDLDLEVGDKVMVEWEEGLKLGTIIKLRTSDSPLPSLKRLQRVIRKVTEADLDYESRKVHKERDVYQACLAKIKEMGLAMNLVKVEHIPNINKFICYFTAEGRIDFRNLVKKLASDFHARVEMKQIGARNRAKMVGGIGRCGRELCCSSFRQDFDPITVRMAKDQGLSLDPTKISGVCGRLMCCLAYEHETYCACKKNLPKCGKKVVTELATGKVTKQDILRQRVWIKGEDGGKEIEVSLNDIKKEGFLKMGKKK